MLQTYLGKIFNIYIWPVFGSTKYCPHSSFDHHQTCKTVPATVVRLVSSAVRTIVGAASPASVLLDLNSPPMDKTVKVSQLL